MTTRFSFICSFALLCCASDLRAQLTLGITGQTVATVNWGAQNDNGLGTAAGIELPQGDLIRIGTFQLTDDQIRASQNDYATLNAAFVPYDTAAIGEGVNVTSGFWAKSTSSSTDALGLDGRKIYLWAFNASTPTAATQQGIFTSTAAGWLFPSDSSVPASVTIDLGQVQPSEIVVGGFGTGTSTETGGALYNLVPVPEPASIATVAAALCLLAAVGRRILVRRPVREGR